MLSASARIGCATFMISLVVVGSLMAEGGANPKRTAPGTSQSTRPDGPAARKAEDLLNAHIARIEKENAEGRKEVDRLRAELHELVDVRYATSIAIADLKGELATKGVYSSNNLPVNAQPAPGMTPGSPIRHGVSPRLALRTRQRLTERPHSRTTRATSPSRSARRSEANDRATPSRG